MSTSDTPPTDPADRPGPERLAKFLELDKHYTAEEAARLVKAHPRIVAEYIMRGDFALGACAMAIEMEEERMGGSP